VLRIRLFRYPRARGWGINLYRGSRRIFAIEWHRFELRTGRTVNRLHYHRRPGIGRHRPWE
jgi:hypothetical protein